MLISSLDVDVVTSSWGPITALPNGAPSLTLAAPAPQGVIAAGSSKEYQFLLSLLGAVPGQHTVVLSMAGDCTSDVLSLTFPVQEPDE